MRDGEPLHTVVPHTAAQFGRAIIMPNLRPPVTTAEQALAYKQRILAAVPAGMSFEPLMTLYLTDNLPPEEIVRAKAAGVVACKLYPAGATTNSDAGVTDLRKTYKTLEAMQKAGMLLLVHGEVTSSDIDLFDREAVFIEQQLIPLRRDFPELKIVFEHITTKDAADYVASADRFTAATITAHHLLYNRNAIFIGGVRPHYYCLPVLKRETHRVALVQAATSGSSKFFGHRQCTAPGAPQGARYRLRGLLHRPRGHRDVCRGVRQRGCARPARRLRQLPRPGLLQPAAQHHHHHPAPRVVDTARQLCVWRGRTQAPARG